jgi:putative Holliday junction resolvase
VNERVLLGFDYGTSSIGVAVGQELTGTARGLTAVKAYDGKPDWAAVTRVIEEWRPALLIVGLPLNMDGTEHEVTTAARRFGNQLAGRYNLPVETIDERLTSIEAEGILAETGHMRPSKSDVDKLAAELILQTWLDERAAGR